MNQHAVFFIVNAEGKYLGSNGFEAADPLAASWFFSRDLALRIAQSHGAAVATYDPVTKQIVQPQP